MIKPSGKFKNSETVQVAKEIGDCGWQLKLNHFHERPETYNTLVGHIPCMCPTWKGPGLIPRFPYGPPACWGNF